jgi:Carboxypeptidase regulatory-like domain
MASKRHVIGAIIGLLLSACVLFGQENTGTMSGTVTDPSGAAVPGAQVVATSELTGQVRTTTSSSSGYYAIPLLPIGSYAVTGAAKGFKQFVRKGIKLGAGQTLTLDLQLELGTTSETVTVSGSPTPLNYTTAAQVETLGTSHIEQLPLPHQDWSALLSLGNGVAKGGILLGITFNGLPAAAVNITMDGTNAQQDPELPTLGFYQGFNLIDNVSADSMSEIAVTKGIAMPSNGTGMSGNINIITKSGTNQFHGSLFEYNDNNALDARNQFLTSKPRSTINTFGGSLGGYIIKNKLFFFGSYEGIRSSTFDALNATMPTMEFRTSTVAVAPEYGAVFQYLPLPNQPYAPGSVTGRYIASASAIRNDGNGDVRFDYYINPTNQVILRWTRSRPYQLTPSAIPINPQTYAGHNDIYNGQFIHSSGSWTAATRFAYNRITFTRLNDGYSAGLDGISYGGFSSGGNSQLYVNNGSIYTGQEDVVVIHSKHTIQFGGIVQRNESGRQVDGTTSFSYSTLSDFLSDIPGSTKVYFPIPLFHDYMYQFGGYAQDAYRISPSLTLNYGMRYDYFTVPKEANGNLYVRNDTSLGLGTGSLRSPNDIYNSGWANFAPRLGFAWSFGQARNTVVRGGFGVFYSSHNLYSGAVDDAQPNLYAPQQLSLSRSQMLAAGLSFPFDKVALETQYVAEKNPVYQSAIEYNFPNPYSLQYMLDVQHSFGQGIIFDTGFVATRGLHINNTPNCNLPDRLTGIAPLPSAPSFRCYYANDVSNYFGWQTSLDRRYASGLEWGTNFTWSRSFASGTGDLEIHTIPQPGSNLRAEYGPTNWDQPLNFNAHVVYEPPIERWAGMSGRRAGLLLGGWQVSSIITAGSGFAAAVTDSKSAFRGDRPDAVNGVDPYLANYQGTLQYLNKAAFARVPISTPSGAQILPGNLARNSIRLPGQWNVDLLAAKSFAITERVNFQLRANFFNAFNHTNLGGLNANLNSSSFGQFTSATARTIEVGAKVTF